MDSLLHQLMKEHDVGEQKESELSRIIREDESLDFILKDRFEEMGRFFDMDLEDNLFNTSTKLSSKYGKHGFNSASEWRDFLDHPSVALYRKTLVEEILKANANRALASNPLTNNEAMKLRNEGKEHENSNVVVFFMGMRNYGNQKKIEKYENKDPSVLLKSRDRNGNRAYTCPVCEVGESTVYHPNFYGECDVCGATVIDFVPLDHQYDVLHSKETYKLVLGGYGSGKTSLTVADLFAHAITTPNGRAAVVAQTLDQVERTVWRELKKIVPPKFILKETKKPMEMLLINGYEILILASDNEEKIRSLEVDYFYIEEASDPKMQYIFDQASARIRRPTGILYDDKGNEMGDKYQVMVVSNPEDTWFMEGFILKSGKITASPSVDKEIYSKLMRKDRVMQYHTFLSSTRDNTYLPSNYLNNLAAGKSMNWIKKYIDCYLDVKEGRVYDDYLESFVPDFSIPNDWVRVAGYDFGVNDPTALLIGAEDPATGTIYFYDEYSVSDRALDDHIMEIREKFFYYDERGHKVPYRMKYPIQADPAIKKRNDRDLQSHQTYFQRRSGLILEPADNRLTQGIVKVRNEMHRGRIKFFNSLEKIKDEFRDYVYKKDRETDTYTDVPVDRNNHLMDCLRYVATKMPDKHQQNDLTVVQPTFNTDTGEQGARVYNPRGEYANQARVGRGRTLTANYYRGGQ